MPEWIENAAPVVAALVALAALIVSIWAILRGARRREFELLLERSDREAAAREAQTREFTEQIALEAAKREAQAEKEAAKRDERFEREAAKRDELFQQAAAKREAQTREFTERIAQETAKREAQAEREAAKREKAIRDVLDRSDRKFEALQRRSDDLYRQSAEITARVAHTEAVLETTAKADPQTRQGEAVAAQDVPGDRPNE